jgi:hypothetical protein
VETRRDATARHAVLRIVTLTVGVSLLVGIATAVVGGPLEPMGDGYGGLWGAPGILLTLCAVAAPIVVWRGQEPRSWLAVGLWPLVVWLAYNFIAHGVDPCVIGLLDGASSVGAQPLCERFGTELNVHTRFHLLLHAGVAALAVFVARRLWPVWRVWPARPGGETVVEGAGRPA